MRHLKTINELFDSEDLKDKYEIPYLQGKFAPEEISKWKSFKNEMDPELHQLVNEIPYLIEFKYRRSGNILSLGFDNTIDYGDGESVFYYLLIEVVKFRDEYSLNVYAKCRGNGQSIYNESMIKKSMSYEDLISQMKRPVFNMIIDFNNFIERMFKESNFSVKDKKTIMFNPNRN